MKRLVYFFLCLFFVLITIPGPVLSAEKPIVIGAPLATAFLYGWDAERGIKLAVEEINAKGGVNVAGAKRPFKVEVIDTRDLEPGVPVSEALLAVEKLILEKKADFIIGGPVRSEAALAAMDLLSKHKKVSIVTTGTLTPLYNKRVADNYNKYKYCFRNSNSSLNMMNEFITFLEDMKKSYGFNKAYIMVQDVEHARKGGEFMKKGLTDKGWQVIDMKIYPTGNTDYSLGLTDAKNKGAQILFIWMDMPESAVLLKQWSDMKIKAIPVGFVCAAEQPGFWKATGGKGEYLIVNLCNGGNAPAKITPWTMKFVEAYKKRWGLEPEGYGTSSSYMAVYQLKDAIERAGSIDPEKVIKALETQDLMGVYGRMRFDKSHQIIPSYDPKEGAVTCIFQWQAGKRVQVFPPKVAEGKAMLPPWMK
ncbi:MAG TPA: ABC transporter substrate-binding protein [Syntrophorhabdaceae bacterium]|nr:ABC transporter substrate-binding protein [Syntrophorhabdaceae bacterium]HOL05158.1 ABC transporter substrate-binding protein [Syntrophorhabdaceae bacterium]HON84738.1 ABC transporter substrate-binding protein [Syntrophorhabdaceae bacterium]HPC66265.1 ABC transporter substrate-binding protein [Syntrophorhabdaceae bacterium]HPP41427.1 ABC transporter substrate-binding protein [Syntrophorhabdaceae bacterium]